MMFAVFGVVCLAAIVFWLLSKVLRVFVAGLKLAIFAGVGLFIFFFAIKGFFF